MNAKFANKKQEMDVRIEKSYCHPYGPKNVVVGLRFGVLVCHPSTEESERVTPVSSTTLGT